MALHRYAVVLKRTLYDDEGRVQQQQTRVLAAGTDERRVLFRTIRDIKFFLYTDWMNRRILASRERQVAHSESIRA